MALLCAAEVANASTANFCKNSADLQTTSGGANCQFMSNEVLTGWPGYTSAWTWNNASCADFKAQNFTDWQGTKKMWKVMAEDKAECCAKDRRKMRCFDRCCNSPFPKRKQTPCCDIRAVWPCHAQALSDTHLTAGVGVCTHLAAPPCARMKQISWKTLVRPLLDGPAPTETMAS